MKITPVQHKFRFNPGFTLIEVVVVLILVGVLAAVAVSRVTDTGAAERAAADSLKAHLRQAQGLSLNSDTVWGVQASGGSYHLFYVNVDEDTNTTTVVTQRFPGEDADDIDFPSGVSATFTVYFDGWGRPCSDQSCDTPITSAITAIGSRVTITPETGYIP
ncbi:MAG: prepilin-type N-terminal cleavage/methylation domain-containing protein [Desulfatiglandaceae bacterium]